MPKHTFDLLGEAQSHTLVTAHRGIFGGNIPTNTLAAFDAALYNRADIVEMDVERSRDGTLYTLHEGNELRHLGCPRSLPEMSDDEVRELRYLSCTGKPTAYPLPTLDEALEHLKGRCYINLDKFHTKMPEVARIIRRHRMEEQILLKTYGTKAELAMIEQYAPDVNFIVMLKEKDDFTDYIRTRNVCFIGVEAHFSTEDAPVCQPAYIEKMHAQGLILWSNAIVCDYRKPFSAGHDDDVSITGHPEQGWGWQVDRGFDILQTDWPCQLRSFLDATGRRNK